jgi:CheY-like chemotaxis protein
MMIYDDPIIGIALAHRNREKRTMPKRKILIVDNSNTVLLMQRMLLSQDYEVITAKNGVDALAKAKQELPDLVLMEAVIPQMDGIEACRTLKTQENTKHIPVIIVTTLGVGPGIESCIRSGCNDYLTKPLDSVQLLSKVRNLLKKSHSSGI